MIGWGSTIDGEGWREAASSSARKEEGQGQLAGNCGRPAGRRLYPSTRPARPTPTSRNRCTERPPAAAGRRSQPPLLASLLPSLLTQTCLPTCHRSQPWLKPGAQQHVGRDGGRRGPVPPSGTVRQPVQFVPSVVRSAPPPSAAQQGSGAPIPALRLFPGPPSCRTQPTAVVEAGQAPSSGAGSPVSARRSLPPAAARSSPPAGSLPPLPSVQQEGRHR